jgi:Domain of unknown function (DUF1772)
MEIAMLVRAWRFITIILAALDTGMALCHALEMPAKLKVDAQQWLTFQHTLYRAFGPKGPGAFIEMGAIITGVVLVILVRKRRPAFHLTLAGATLVAAAFFLVWIPFVSPVNAETAKWTVDSIPGNWMELRRQWEYAHTIRFVLQLIGLGALMLSVLVETPTDRFGGRVAV